MDFIPAELSPFIVVIVAVLLLWVAWRVISGLIRLVVTVAVILIALYIVWTLLGNMGMV
jgi:hypothetical protein